MPDRLLDSRRHGPPHKVTIAVDIGGTFTDILGVMPDRRLLQKKVLSSVDDYGRAIITGLHEMLEEAGLDGVAIGDVRHGTTIASNTILERTGAKVGLIATAGFRDVLEIRNLRMPVLYDLHWEKPKPLVPRRLRATVDERIGAGGEILRGLDCEGAEAAIRRLLSEGVEAFAVCLINSFVNARHEQLIGELIARIDPKIPVSLSSDVLPEIKEYERTSTTVVNAYVGINVRRYLAELEQRLKNAGMCGSLRIMQSNGALMSSTQAVDLPVHIIESGPAAGVVGAQAVARASEAKDVISFDMGGTTSKVSLIENSMVTHAAEFQVGGGLISSSRLLTGAGHLVKVPAIDIAEVGAGGGSIIHVDRAGGLKVGPRSAGAYPGPVCYGFGGSEVTITDANLILGYVNPVAIAGGTVRLDRETALARFMETVAEPIGMSVEAAAHGAFLVATSTMIGAIRAVTVERGRDPRGFGLIAFGGNGPIFAHALAEALGIQNILIPQHAGLFSAVGLLAASSAVFRSATFRRNLADADAAEIEAAWRAVEEKAASELQGLGAERSAIVTERRASLRYIGQRSELTIPAPHRTTSSLGAALMQAFAEEHLRTYGHRGPEDEPVELVTLQVICQPAEPRRALTATASDVTGLAGVRGTSLRKVYFGPKHGWLDVPVLCRADLAARRDGPLIVEEPDTACVVPPGMRAVLDEQGSIAVSWRAAVATPTAVNRASAQRGEKRVRTGGRPPKSLGDTHKEPQV